MKKSRLHQDSDESSVDMTPMLDIVFILLIFFIVTTSFVREEGLEITKPKKQNTPPTDSVPSIIVKISPNGQINFNGNLVDIERLPARIESFLSTNITTTAIVIPDHEATHEMVVKVIDQISQFDSLNVAIGQ